MRRITASHPSVRLGLAAAAVSLLAAAAAPVTAGAAPRGSTAASASPVRGEPVSEHLVQQRTLGAAAPAALRADPAHTRLAARTDVRTQAVAGNPRMAREVLGFAPYWALPGWQEWQLSLLSTIAYFGVSLDANGNAVTGTDAGWTGWQSQQLTALVSAAHAQGVRVLLTVKAFDDATINGITGSSANAQRAIGTAIGLAQSRGLDGVDVDFEGASSAAYPNLQQQFTAFMASLTPQVHAAIAGSEVVVDTYSGSASWNSGFFNIGALAPNVDAFFVMAYDMYSGNMANNASANAPLNGWTYNDTLSVQQYTSMAPASKVILGVPYYGYKWSVTAPTANAPVTSGASADTYSAIFDDLACAQQLTQHWDAVAASPWTTWWSPPTNDPCGGDYNSWRELYWDNTASLGAKYDLVNHAGIRGTGMWALGYDSGHTELWDVLASRFLSDATLPVLDAVVGGDRHLYVRNPALGGGAAFVDMGGLTTMRPAALGPRGGDPAGADLYGVVGLDGHPWLRRDGSGWVGVGSAICTSGLALSAAPGGAVAAACRGQDGAVWVSVAPSTSPTAIPRLTAWRSLGGNVTSAPGLALDGGALRVVARGTDGRPWSRTTQTGWSPLPASCTGDLGLAAAGSVVVTACRGTDGALWAAVSRAGTGAFGAWSSLGGRILAGPGLTDDGSGHLLAYVQGADGQLWYVTATLGPPLGGPGPWIPVGGRLLTGPAAAAR